jgi:hypothetical protein
MPAAPPRIRLQAWSPDYGSPNEIDYGDEPDAYATIPTEEPFGFVLPPPSAEVPLAFVDGIQQVEANLVQEFEDRVVPGIACAYAVGAVVIPVGADPEYKHCRAERLVVWTAGLAFDLPEVTGGWRWRSVSVPDTGIKSAQGEMVSHRRTGEATLGHTLDNEGWWVVCDGTDGRLFTPRPTGEPRVIVGCIKSHHVQLLPHPQALKLPELPERHRTTLFRTPSNRYSCYLRLGAPEPWQAALSGIIRLEFAGNYELAQLRTVADVVAYHLPRYAGVPHVDPRAPQNLQPIGALETYLRRLLGDGTLARRALHDAIGGLTP